MSDVHQCFGDNCRTCKKQPSGRIPVVKDCWYDVPYPCLEGFLRIVTLIVMLFILFVLIHLTVGQISTLKPFSAFLERAHLITDASELGILGKPSKEEGFYSPHQDEKEDGDQMKGTQSLQHSRNTSKLSDLPMDIYKGTDDDDAYFITFREVCDDKAADKRGDGDAAQAIKSGHRDHTNRLNPSQYLGIEGLRDARIASPQIKADDLLGTLNEIRAQKMRLSPHQNSRPISIQKIPLEAPVQTKPHQPEQRVRDLQSFESLMRIREGLNKNQQNLDLLSLSKVDQRLDKEKSEGVESRGNAETDVQPPRQIPNLKLLLNDRPKSVIDMTIDMNNPNNDAPKTSNQALKQKDYDQDGIFIEDEEMQAVSADDARNFLKDKITRQIQNKEEEIMDRMENRPRSKPNVMEVEANDLGSLNMSELAMRKPRAVENIDRSITYTEHERTMKQEVEVTYKRAQDIAKAILKTSEAIANSLDLCRKPISTNFISDEPLTEAEDIIDQIVGQLKESLELTMGCRTCVKPHKDLMLFLRWLIFDDVSVKLCPSKPKAADLRKNYLLFNHDNAFLGRVCGAGEYPRAPLNCSVEGEAKGHTEEETSVQSKTHSKQVGKNRHRADNANTNSNNKT